MMTLLEMCQLEFPKWAALSQGFQNMVTDPSLLEEAGSLQRYSQFLGNEAFKLFTNRWDRERDSLADWREFWAGSSLHDPIITDMVQRTFEHHGLYTGDKMAYFLMVHMNERLNIDSGLDIKTLQGLTKGILLEGGISEAELGLIDYLADNCQEMNQTIYSALPPTSLSTLVPELFPIRAIRSSQEEYDRRRRFYDHHTLAAMLRRFAFVEWFDRGQPEDTTAERSQMVLAAFPDLRSAPDYQEFLADPKAYSERLYQNAQMEV
jgi:hypothetical protein